MRPVIGRVEELAGRTYGGKNEQENVAFQVIADHTRATTFLIADGVLPSNEGRGYVLRRIMRRAIRFGRLLNLPSPFMGQVSARVVELMGEVYPDLRRGPAVPGPGGDRRRGALRRHPGPRPEALERGTGLSQDPQAQDSAGEVAFKLYDTYGFPLDLVQDILREENLVLDLEGFEDNMKRQREASRQSWRGGGHGRGAAGLPGTGPMAAHPLPGLRGPGGRQHHPGPHHP